MNFYLEHDTPFLYFQQQQQCINVLCPLNQSAVYVKIWFLSLVAHPALKRVSADESWCSKLAAIALLAGEYCSSRRAKSKEYAPLLQLLLCKASFLPWPSSGVWIEWRYGLVTGRSKHAFCSVCSTAGEMTSWNKVGEIERRKVIRVD